MVTTTSKKTPQTSNGFTDKSNAVRIVTPIYVSLVSRHLAKKLLNALRSKANASAGAVPNPGAMNVITATTTQAQIDMEQRLGVSLHVLRTLLMAGRSEGMPLDLLLRIQKEVDFVFIDQSMIKRAQDSAMNHFLAHADITAAEFKKLKCDYLDEEES